jgi:hypothetical protein
VGPLSPCHGASSSCGWREGLKIQRLVANVLNNQSRTGDNGWSSSFGVGVGLTIRHRKNITCYEMFQNALELD